LPVPQLPLFWPLGGTHVEPEQQPGSGQVEALQAGAGTTHVPDPTQISPDAQGAQ
jgi:hypothetical protein